MSSILSRIQRRQERDVRVKFLEDDLPPAESPQPGGKTVLRGHEGHVWHVVAIPESGLIATASFHEPGLRIFALDGHSDPLHVCSGVKGTLWRALVALGGDVLAYGDDEGNISTWRASAGARLETCDLGGQDRVSAMAKVGPGKFVVGTGKGVLVFFSHRDGRDLHEAGRGNLSHGRSITDIAVRGDAIVTASGDKTAAVWSAATRERAALLSGHSDQVEYVAVCARFIATGSRDKTIRLYEAGAGHALVRVFEALHSDCVFHVGFVGEDLLMSASWDETVAFTSISSGKPVARLNAGFRVFSASITPDARIACIGGYNAAIFTPPALVTTAVEDHAASVFPPQALTCARNEPLQAAMVKVLAGSLDAGDACRALVTEENCSRSIAEWACAHRLLMAAVADKNIPGELDFEGERSHWFDNLYTTCRSLPMGRDDRNLVKEFFCQAKEAGVIETREGPSATVIVGQDLLELEAKIQVSEQKIVSVLWEVMARQAENDDKISKLITKVQGIDRCQKLNAVFGFVFSFVPLGGNALAQGLVGADKVWSLLDSAMSAGVGIQGAVTPLLLDKFTERASLMIAPEGWKTISVEDQSKFKDLVQALGMTWEDFRDIVDADAAALRRNCKATCADRSDTRGTGGISEALPDSSFVPDVIDDVSSHVGSSAATSIVQLERNDEGETAISSIANEDEATCNFEEFKIASSDVENLKSAELPTKPLMRLCIDILGKLEEAYNVSIIGDHIPGEENVMPDAASRRLFTKFYEEAKKEFGSTKLRCVTPCASWHDWLARATAVIASMKLPESEWRVDELMAADLDQGQISDDLVRHFEPNFSGEAFDGATCGPSPSDLHD